MKVKTSIRKKLIQQRNGLKKINQNTFSQQICDHVLSHPHFFTSRVIAIYYPIGNEVNLLPLLTTNKKIALPVVQRNKTMLFKVVDPENQFMPNKYGILEPTSETTVNPEEIDLCLLPLVGFNRKGHRLGMGGGYYDKYFALNKFQQNPTILAGIAYDFQEDDTIPTEPWDIPLDIIFTNKEVIIP